ncbi:MAG: twin-arginine translocase TatA/TatE family subunit [Blastocatellia bacterium]|nr:twin-arginine translocase TatA/TatE family subunit [Blastocatellia bacterium]
MNNLLLLGLPGGMEWIIILLVVLLLFGANRLPQLAKGMGESIRNFKQGMAETEAEEEKPGAKDKAKAEEEKPGAKDKAKAA